MKSISYQNTLFFILFIIIVILLFYYAYQIFYKSEELFSLPPNLNESECTNESEYTKSNKIIESYENISYDNYKNIIPNGDFLNGKDVGGYVDQSGSNKIIEKTNPGPGKYVLQQSDTNDLTFYEIIQPVTPNSTYIFMAWVLLEDAVSGTPDFSKLLKVRILKENGSNEIPVIKYTIERTSTLNNNDRWYLVKYAFYAPNNLKANMNMYLNYSTTLIAKNIYYANLRLYKVLSDIPDFIFTNGLTAFISGFYCDNGVISWRDLGSLGNNFELKNRAVVDSNSGFVNMYNNIATQKNGKSLFQTTPMFMINLLVEMEKSTSSTPSEEDDVNEYKICAIQNSNGKDMISLKINKDHYITLQCNDLVSTTKSGLILSNKTLLSIGFNNDLHTIIFYQDSAPILRIDNCPTLYFDNSTFILNPNQYLQMKVYDCIVHNYVLLESEHKELRSYLMDATKRAPKTKPSFFDYIIPKSWNVSSEDDKSYSINSNRYSNNNDPNYSMKDDFYRSFLSSEQVYTNVKKEACDKKIEVKPSDCPTSYKKGNDYYIYIPKDSYYHNKLGYYGEKLYGDDKAKVKYIYQMNFPECQLPIILTDNEGGKYSNTCPFIIEKNNPCNMVGCGSVDWNKEYVEDLGLNDKCKKAVSYYCRINYDLDPKCKAWKPENKNDPASIHIRDYFESPDEYCDIKRYKIEDHPDFKNYIRKDKIPCWGCKVD